MKVQDPRLADFKGSFLDPRYALNDTELLPRAGDDGRRSDNVLGVGLLGSRAASEPENAQHLARGQLVLLQGGVVARATGGVTWSRLGDKLLHVLD